MHASALQPVVFTRLAALIAVISTMIACIPECGQREHLEKIRAGQLRDAALLFHKDNQRWPSEVDGLIPMYIKEQPKDRWRRPFRLQQRNHSLVVISAGADGVFGTTDDATVVVVQ